MTELLGCIGLIPAVILAYVLRAWAIITLWTWFIYPTWHLAIPSRPTALGLVTLIAILVPPPPRGPDHEPGRTKLAIFATAYAEMLLPPLLAVGVGWLIK